MHPQLFSIWGIHVYSWGFMVALGFLAGIITAVINAKRENIAAEQVIDIAMYVLLSAIVGARIFYVIQFWGEFKSDPLSVFAVWNGGMVFYGGLIFSIATIYAYTRVKRISFVKILDIASLSAAIGYSIGRIGCFLRGCCFGSESALPWAVHFPELSGLRHPTQIYSSLSGLIIFAILLSIIKRKKYDGEVFLFGILLYSIYRFLIEFLRYSPYYYLGLTASQWISAAGFAVSLLLIIRNRK